jgi:hypothetical protein
LSVELRVTAKWNIDEKKANIAIQNNAPENHRWSGLAGLNLLRVIN